MHKDYNLITNIPFEKVTGPIPFNLTNDYMFKATLQECTEARIGLIGAILGMDPSTIEAEVINPIELGKSIASKDSAKIYTDAFLLSVVNLKRIDEATERDRQYRLDKWCRFITASTWEELKELAKEDTNMQAAAENLYLLSSDFEIREEAIRRRDYYNYVHSLEAEIAEKDAHLAEKDASLAEKDAEIAELKKRLGLPD